MTFKTLAFAAAAIVATAAGTALAHDVYDDVFFVRAQASAGQLFKDRSDCRSTAEHMSDTAASYSNPQYGALSAMGSALDEDALHDGGLRKRLQRAVLDDCMKQKGWTPAEVSAEDLRTLMRADARHPQLLDAWLKAHEPAPAPAPAPTAPVVKTAAPASEVAKASDNP
jgi:hypothetical protein